MIAREEGEEIAEYQSYKACRALWVSVLWQGVCDAVRLASAARPWRRAYSDDAVEWIMADEEEVGSFRWICGVVNLDPGRVRERVAKMIENAKSGDGRVPRFIIQSV